jgi:hypothetical protein
MVRAWIRDGPQGANRRHGGAMARIGNAADRQKSGCATREDLFSVTLITGADLLETQTSRLNSTDRQHNRRH